MKKIAKLPDRVLGLFLLLIVLLSLSVLTAEAHGGGTPQLINAEAGPFLVSVWTLPEPLTEGDVHLTVALSEATDGGNARAGVVVLNAGVQITLVSQETGEEITSAATHEKASNKFFYETDVVLPAGGRWQAIIDINHEGQQGQATFDFAVESAGPNVNWTLIGGSAVGLLAVGWFLWQSRRDEEELVETKQATG